MLSRCGPNRPTFLYRIEPRKKSASQTIRRLTPLPDVDCSADVTRSTVVLLST